MTYGHAGSDSKPSGATAIAAGVLVGLTGLWHVFGLVAGVVVISGETNVRNILVGIGLNALIAGVSLTGAVTLLARMPAGRVMVVVAGVLAIAMYLTLSLWAPAGSSTGPGAAALAIVGIPALAAVVLAVLPATGRWLSRRTPAVAPPSYQPRAGGQYVDRWPRK